MKGAFTGAGSNRQGLFESANSGTIFLDEIGEMTPAMQVKLLRVLQERKLRPLGGTAEVAIDVRVVAATNRDLKDSIAKGLFREDLYYRITVITLRVPALRERLEDVVLLAFHFLRLYAAKSGKRIYGISTEAGVTRRLELLGELHGERRGREPTELVVNVGGRQKLSHQLILMLAVGRAVHGVPDEKPRLLVYAGLQFDLPGFYRFDQPERR